MTTPSEQYAQALQAKFNRETVLALAAGKKVSPRRLVFSVEHGKKFDRIVQAYEGDTYGQTVHAFVEQESSRVIKAAGWKAPQKGVNGLAYRYDLSTPTGFATAVEAADRYGSYLYQR